MAVPFGLYGSETWRLNTKTQSRIQASEMSLEVSWRDRLRNDNIRNILGIYNLKERIKQYTQGWTDHVERMLKNRIPKQMLAYNPKGRRNIVRPKKRWSDQGVCNGW